MSLELKILFEVLMLFNIDKEPKIPWSHGKGSIKHYMHLLNFKTC